MFEIQINIQIALQSLLPLWKLCGEIEITFCVIVNNHNYIVVVGRSGTS